MGLDGKRRLTRKEWVRKRRRERAVRFSIVTLAGVAALTLLIFTLGKVYQWKQGAKTMGFDKADQWRPEIMEAFLTPNPYSRPQEELVKIRGVVVHYTANPGSTGWGNRNYFESLKDSHATKVSSHFIVGLDGTIIQCVPLNEVAYASNERNVDTVSIECCHPGKNGKFTKKTYESLVKLVRWLVIRYDLDKEDVIRHFDITGKICPKYFVEHEDKWSAFRDEVFEREEKK